MHSSGFNSFHRLCFQSFVALCAFSSLASADSLQESLAGKLQLQWQRYEQARQTVIDKVGCTGAPIDRATWETLVNLPARNAFTPEEIQRLKKNQADLIAKSRLQAIAASKQIGVDLNNIRSSGRAAQFCQAMPKGGMLHIHPSGTINEQTANQLLRQINPPIHPQELITATNTFASHFSSERLSYLTNLPESKNYADLNPQDQQTITSLFLLPEAPYVQGFVPFSAEFSFTGKLFSYAYFLNPSDIYIPDFLARAHSEHVSYVEFTSACPSDLASLSTMSKDRWNQTHATGMVLNNNCSFSRIGNAAKNMAAAKTLFESLIQASKAGTPLTNVTGIDLLSDEDPKDNPSIDVTALASGQGVYACRMKMMRDNGLKVHATMHAGELGDPTDPRDALILGTDRIGHGVLLENDPIALEYARLHKIPVEINLVSNVRLKAIDVLANHPYLHYLRLGLPVSLSTDDEGMLHTDINNDCVQAINQTDVTYAELKQMAFNSIQTSFASPEAKAQLTSQLQSQFTEFEQQAYPHMGQY